MFQGVPVSVFGGSRRLAAVFGGQGSEEEDNITLAELAAREQARRRAREDARSRAAARAGPAAPPVAAVAAPPGGVAAADPAAGRVRTRASFEAAAVAERAPRGAVPPRVVGVAPRGLDSLGLSAADRSALIHRVVDSSRRAVAKAGDAVRLYEDAVKVLLTRASNAAYNRLSTDRKSDVSQLTMEAQNGLRELPSLLRGADMERSPAWAVRRAHMTLIRAQEFLVNISDALDLLYGGEQVPERLEFRRVWGRIERVTGAVKALLREVALDRKLTVGFNHIAYRPALRPFVVRSDLRDDDVDFPAERPDGLYLDREGVASGSRGRSEEYVPDNFHTGIVSDAEDSDASSVAL